MRGNYFRLNTFFATARLAELRRRIAGHGARANTLTCAAASFCSLDEVAAAAGARVKDQGAGLRYKNALMLALTFIDDVTVSIFASAAAPPRRADIFTWRMPDYSITPRNF